MEQHGESRNEVQQEVSEGPVDRKRGIGESSDGKQTIFRDEQQDVFTCQRRHESSGPAA